MKNLRNEKGSTLVALVVTIIVLLILAGVSLSLVAGGNGIINKAATAQDRTIEGSAKEQVELRLAELAADYYEAKYVNNDSGITTKEAFVTTNLVGAAGDYAITGDNTTGYTVAATGTTNNREIATFKVDSDGKITGWAVK